MKMQLAVTSSIEVASFAPVAVRSRVSVVNETTQNFDQVLETAEGLISRSNPAPERHLLPHG
jgi:hypothetical protein